MQRRFRSRLIAARASSDACDPENKNRTLRLQRPAQRAPNHFVDQSSDSASSDSFDEDQAWGSSDAKSVKRHQEIMDSLPKNGEPMSNKQLNKLVDHCRQLEDELELLSRIYHDGSNRSAKDPEIGSSPATEYSDVDERPATGSTINKRKDHHVKSDLDNKILSKERRQTARRSVDNEKYHNKSSTSTDSDSSCSSEERLQAARGPVKYAKEHLTESDSSTDSDSSCSSEKNLQAARGPVKYAKEHLTESNSSTDSDSSCSSEKNVQAARGPVKYAKEHLTKSDSSTDSDSFGSTKEGAPEAGRPLRDQKRHHVKSDSSTDSESSSSNEKDKSLSGTIRAVIRQDKSLPTKDKFNKKLTENKDSLSFHKKKTISASK
ncbi:hypothetical protein QQS21_002105 [Conoideocrella luteorostrata]|uniref:Uncharacterized protein n=1 Tax=Conoideocrella luteorostrata TaxID=1105319 RepID=A0AAJ0CYA3_9HYPO|nr:hypothetical protein QQS21_002105 [Conoideocrella luteorostrata]